jgi:hypothetical protein
VREAFLVLVIVTLSAVACSGSEDPRPVATPSNLPATVALANYEIVTDQPTRFLAGILVPDGRVVTGGTVQMRFTPLDASGAINGSTSETVTGTYLAADPSDAVTPDQQPQATSPDSTPGVYEVEGVTFSQAGPWAVEVTAQVDGVGVVQGSVTFDVVAEAAVPAPGDRAPRADNAVIGDRGVPDDQIDSRALDGEPIPDPSLHRVSITDSIERGRPAVVLFSTPTYCQSRFCGPVTDMVESLSRSYGEQADFIHVEVWKDFERSIANPAAVTWLLEDDGLNEPWLFVVDENGRIVERWDNLVIRDEVESTIQQL